MLHVLALAAAIAAANPAATAEQPAKAAKPKLVCRTELPTGSRLGGTRICKTQAEWDDIARNSRDTLDNSIRRGMQVTCPRGAAC